MNVYIKYIEIKETKYEQVKLINQKQSLFAWICKTLNQKGEA